MAASSVPTERGRKASSHEGEPSHRTSDERKETISPVFAGISGYFAQIKHPRIKLQAAIKLPYLSDALLQSLSLKKRISSGRYIDKP